MAENEKVTPKSLPNYGFWRGFRGSTRGAEVILRHPKLLMYMMAAMLINGVLLGWLIYWGWGHTDGLRLWLTEQSAREATGFMSKSWIVLAGWLKYLFVGLKWLLLILILYFVAPTVYTILLNLNPASALLASEMFKHVFKHEVGIKLPEAPFVEGLLRMILTEIAKLLVMVFLMLGALLLNIIPVIGSIASVVLMLIIGIQFSGWSYITPYYEALNYGYKDQRSAMRKQRSMLWGLGAISAIPIFNFFALFIGPVGGALLAAELHKELTGATAGLPKEDA